MVAPASSRRHSTRLARGLAWTAGVVFVCCALLWCLVWFRFSSGLQQRLASLRQRGEPTRIAEIIPLTPPAEQNGALLYMQVLQVDFASDVTRQPQGLAGLSSQQLRLLDDFCRHPDAGKAVAAGKLLRQPAVQRALALLQAGSERPLAVFPVRWEEGYSASLPHLAALHNSARLLSAAALTEAWSGNPEAAGRHLLTALRLAWHVSQEPLLIGQLRSWGDYALISQAAASALNRCSLSPGALDLLRGQVERAEVSSHLQRALSAERVFGLEMFRQAARDPGRLASGGMDSGAPLAPLLFVISRSVFSRPFWQMQQVLYLDHLEAGLRQAALPYGRRPKSALPRDRPWDLTAALLPDLARVAQARDQALARLALMQVALQLEEYHAARGFYPAALAALGPRLPGDPFSGTALIYRRTGAKYLLYSVGPNLDDDGGRQQARVRGIPDGDLVW